MKHRLLTLWVRDLQKLLLIGDSMFGSGSSGTTIIAATGRLERSAHMAVPRQSSGGNAPARGFILGDRWAGQVIGTWHGQNNQPTTDLGAAQVREASIKLHKLAWAMFIRVLFLTVMGQR
ncbi:hypothetical protein V6S19_00600 [Klebsiella pneumoniae]